MMIKKIRKRRKMPKLNVVAGILQPFLAFLLSSFGYQMDLPVFNMETLTTILIGMLGMSGLRSYEKVKKAV